MLGYEKTESIFLPGEYLRGIFTLSGMVMAPVLLHGRVAGRWKQRDGRLTLTPFGTWTAADRTLALRAAEERWMLKKVVWEE